MKFEIDEKTGMVKNETTLDFIPTETTSGDSPISYHPVTPHQLETILQAVKKTQEKLVNKQIQGIQDSKNKVNFDIKDATFTVQDSLGNTKTFDKRHIQHIEIVDDSRNHYQDLPLTKIEQNQKIVDEVIRIHFNKELPQTPPIIANFMKAIVQTATGKHIEDL